VIFSQKIEFRLDGVSPYLLALALRAE